MGGGASIQDLPDTLSEEQCKAIAGQGFDEGLFQALSSDGCISKTKFLQALKKRTDVFLTHDWGKELGMDNHARVAIINKGLKERGLVTWFDEEQMQGNIKKQMVSGIDNAQCVVVFITKRYVEKVQGDNAEDNCQLEFNYAGLRKSGARMVSVVMEERMRNTRAWGGEVGMVLGGRLYTDMSGNLDDPDYLNSCLDSLYASIMQLIGKSVKEMGIDTVQADVKVQNNSPPPSAVAAPAVSSTPADVNKKPLDSLTVDEVGNLMDALKMSAFKSALRNHAVDGATLLSCSSVEEIKELGISLTAKAKVFFQNISGFKTSGVPLQLLTYQEQSNDHGEGSDVDDYDGDNNGNQDTDNDAEDSNFSPGNTNILKGNIQKRNKKHVPVCPCGHKMPAVLHSNSQPGYEEGWECDCCGMNTAVQPTDEEVGQYRYWCKVCSNDLCINCFDEMGGHLPDPPFHILPSDQQHPMALTTYIVGPHNTPGYEGGWTCDSCENTFSNDTSFSYRLHCVPCQSDFCMNCAANP